MMETAGVERKGGKPSGTELELIVDQEVPIVRCGGRTRRRQGGLLDQVVLRMVAVQGGTEEPLRARRLGPIDSRGEQGVAERHGNRTWHADRVHADPVYGNQSCGRKLRKCRELLKAVRAVGDAGIFPHILQRREKPQFALPQRAAERENFVLPGKWLLGIGLGVIQGIAGIQVPASVEEIPAAVPCVTALAGADDH